MYPIHKEKYIVSEETFFNFMYDRLEGDLKKEKRQHLMYAILMFVVGVVVFAVTLLSESVKGDFVWSVLPIVFLILCASFVLKYNKAYSVLAKKILTDYNNKKYAEKYYTLKFYEDKMSYSFGEEKEEFSYGSLKKFYEGKSYFALYFNTGDLVLMSDKCNTEKVKEIFAGYKESLVSKSEEE